jgi:hypothetical protein
MVGPELSLRVRNVLPVPFTGSYVLLTAIYVLHIAVLFAIDWPMIVRATASSGAHAEEHTPARELLIALKHPDIIFAMIAAPLSFATMAGVMTATPLAIDQFVCNSTAGDTTLAVEVHVVGMFLPAVLVGASISKIGALWTAFVGNSVAILGCLLYFASFSSLVVIDFAIALVGVG